MPLQPIDIKRERLMTKIELYYRFNDEGPDDGNALEAINYAIDPRTTFRNGEPLDNSDRVWLVRQILNSQKG